MKRSAFALFSILLSAALSGCVTGEDRQDALKTAFHDQVRDCYVLPSKAAATETAVIEARFKPDGSLAQPPKVVQGSATSAAAKAGLRALKECTPFAISPTIAARYPEWKVMRIGFNPN